MSELKPCPERIWLIPEFIDGCDIYVWCDNPTPGINSDPDDATEYIRVDLAQSRRSAERGLTNDQIQKLADELRNRDKEILILRGKLNDAEAGAGEGFDPDYKDDPETLGGVIRDLTEACSNAEKDRAALLGEVRMLRDEVRSDLDRGDAKEYVGEYERRLTCIVDEHGGGE